MKDILKYEKLAQTLIGDMAGGIYPPGSAIPSQPRLMELFGVSKITVRKAVDLLENEGYIRKGLGRGNGTIVLNRSEGRKKTRLACNFGIFGDARILDITHHDIPAVAKGIIAGLEHWNASLSMYPFLSERHPTPIDYARSVISRNMVDGLYVTNSKGSRELCEYLKSIHFPFVYLLTAETSEDFLTNCDFPIILVQELPVLSNILADYQKRGCREVVLFAAKEDLMPGRTDTMLKQICPILNLSYRVRDLSYAEFEKVIHFLKQDISPDRLVISSNFLLDRIDDALSLLGIKEPEKLNLIFYKHYASALSFTGREYAVIDRPYEKFGFEAARLMHDLMKKKEIGIDPCMVQKIIFNSFLTTQTGE